MIDTIHVMFSSKNQLAWNSLFLQQQITSYRRLTTGTFVTWHLSDPQHLYTLIKCLYEDHMMGIFHFAVENYNDQDYDDECPF